MNYGYFGPKPDSKSRVKTLLQLNGTVELVIVVMNEGEADLRVSLSTKSEIKAYTCELPAHSIVTLRGRW